MPVAFKNGALVAFSALVEAVAFRNGADVASTASALVEAVAFKNGALVVLTATSTWVVGAVILDAAAVVVLRNKPVDVALSAELVLVRF